MKRTLAAITALLLAAPSASADEVQFGLRSLNEYESELTTTAGGEDDWIFTFGPTTRIVGERRRFNYEVEHFSGYQKYVDFGELDDWRHELRARFQYDISPRAQLQVVNSFQQLPQLRAGNVEDAAVDEEEQVPTLNLQNGTVLTNVFSTTLTLVPLPRLVSTSQVAIIYREFEDPSLNAQNTVSTTLFNQLSYQLNEAHALGFGGRWSTRDFETGDLQGDRDANTQTYEAFAHWVWNLDERSTFTGRVGPAWTVDDIDPAMFPTTIRRYPVAIFNIFGQPTGFVRDPNTCPPENARPGGFLLTDECFPVFIQPFGTGFELGFTGPELETLLGLETMVDVDQPDERGQADVNVFFSFTLDRRWDRLLLSATFSRSDSQTQSLGAATVVNSVYANARYDITSRLQLQATFRFSRRQSDVERELVGLIISDMSEVILDIPAPAGGVLGFPIVGTTTEDRSFEQTQDSYNLRVRLSRQIGRYSSAFVGVNLRRQDTELDGVIDSQDFTGETESWQFQMGFTWRFRPIRF